MNKKAKIQIIKASETSEGTSFWKFTPADLNSFIWTIRSVWIFKEQLDENKLRAGFSLLLNSYPHIAGRIEWDKGVQMNNKGIPFITAYRKNISISEVSSDPHADKNYTLPLSKRKMKSGRSALYSIKLTYIQDGTILGVSGSHALLDGTSFYWMIFNWGCICRGQPINQTIINQTLFPYNEGNISKKDTFNKALEKGFIKFDFKQLFGFLKYLMSNRLYRRTSGFHFKKEVLNSLKNKVAAETGFTCTTNEFLSAYLTYMCSRLNGHGDLSTPYSCDIVVNFRKRVSTLPSHFVGNASTALHTPALPANASINLRIKKIHDALAPMLSYPSEEMKELVELTARVISKKYHLLPFNLYEMFRSKPTVISINNFTKMPIYNVDFGLGKPFAMIPHNLGNHVLIWPAPPGKDGVEIYFSGSFACCIDNLKQDAQWITDFENTRLFGKLVNNEQSKGDRKSQR